MVSVLETEYGSDQNDLIRHVTDSVYFDLVCVLETEYGSDQNDFIRHVTDSVVLRFGVGVVLLESKQDTVRGLQIPAFTMYICMWTYLCHNSRTCHVYVNVGWS